MLILYLSSKCILCSGLSRFFFAEGLRFETTRRDLMARIGFVVSFSRSLTTLGYQYF